MALPESCGLLLQKPQMVSEVSEAPEAGQPGAKESWQVHIVSADR